MIPNDIIDQLDKGLPWTNLTFTTPDTGTEDERCEAMDDDDLDASMPGFFDLTNADELAAWWETERKKLASDPRYWVQLDIRDLDPFEYPIRVRPDGTEYYGVPDKLPYLELTSYLFQGDTVTRL